MNAQLRSYWSAAAQTRFSRSLVLSLFATGILATPGLRAAETGPVAAYVFDERDGEFVRDTSIHGHDGEIVGGAAWAPKGIAGQALLLNGRNRVRIPPATQLDFDGAHSVSAWIRGRASATHFAGGYPDLRPAYYQVVGDTIYLATNSDAFVDDANKSVGSHLRGKDIYHIYTGRADATLTNWTYRRQTVEPFSGFEPRLNVVGSRIYYEYTGTGDGGKANQIWTAESALDGSAWRAFQRTESARYDLLPPDDGRPDTMDVDRALYRTDHGQICVVGNTIYIAYAAMDRDHVWQLWTGVSNLDGSGYRSHQRTTDRGWIPSGIQAVGDRVYYLYPKGNNIFETYGHNRVPGTATGPKSVEGFYVATTNLQGEDWKVIRRIGGPCPSGDSGSFYLSNGRIYLIWSEFEADGVSTRLHTGDMDLAGGDFRRLVRTSAGGYVKTPIVGGVQVVGNRIYYLFARLTTTAGRAESSLWTAESNLDGSGWEEQRIDGGARNLGVGYKGLVVVGAKRYLAPGRPREGLLGFGGANIVNKGDAYGLGLTEGGRPRGFVNAGQDFIFRGEATVDTAGAIADGDTELTGDNWHHVASVYDQQRIQLFVNGRLRAAAPYRASPRRNPFPLVLGDGFVGAIDEVQLFNRALSADEVMKQYRRFR